MKERNETIDIIDNFYEKLIINVQLKILMCNTFLKRITI